MPSRREVQPSIYNYFAPLDVGKIDIEDNKARYLVIHDSKNSVQSAVDSYTEGLPAGSFDRIAIPQPSEKIRDLTLVRDWIEKLWALHDFDEIHLLEPKNRYQKSARAMLQSYFPEFKVEVINPQPVDTEPAKVLAAHCSDKRFQPQFLAMVHRIIEPTRSIPERLVLPGASLGLDNPRVLAMVSEIFDENDIGEVHLMDHTDCGVVGGLEAYNDWETEEAMVHADSLYRARREIQGLLPLVNPEVVPHIVGIEGLFSMKAIKAALQRKMKLH